MDSFGKRENYGLSWFVQIDDDEDEGADVELEPIVTTS